MLFSYQLALPNSVQPFAFEPQKLLYYIIASFVCQELFSFFVQSRLSSKKFFLSIETVKALRQQLLHYITLSKIVKNFFKLFFKKFFHFSFEIVFFVCNR